MRCVKCGKVIRVDDGVLTEGVGFEGYSGYGSRHDGEKFRIYVCDDCLEKSKEQSKKFVVKLDVTIDAEKWSFEAIQCLRRDFVQAVINDQGLTIFNGCEVNVVDVEDV